MPDIKSRCFGNPDCPMTAGYSIGGGYYICWLHILKVPGGYLYYRAKPVIMPTDEQQAHIKCTWGEEEQTIESRLAAWIANSSAPS